MVNTSDTFNSARESMPNRIDLLRTVAGQIVASAINLDIDGICHQLRLELVVATDHRRDNPDDPDGEDEVARASAALLLAEAMRAFAREAWGLGARPQR